MRMIIRTQGHYQEKIVPLNLDLISLRMNYLRNLLTH